MSGTVQNFTSRPAFVIITARTPASTGDETAGRPASTETERGNAMQRRRFTQTTTLDERLEDRAKRFRDEARGTHPGVERDRLIRLARQAETAAHMSDWLRSPGLQPPK